MKKEITFNWYEQLIDDCKTIIVETEFNSRWALVEGYHALGTRILEENNNFEREKIYGEKIVSRVTESLGKSPRLIWRSIQFARKFPDLMKLPEGKNTSWHDVCNKYLPQPKENKIEYKEINGEYGLIVIDPPWKYGTEYDSESRRVASPYPELSREELLNLKLPAAKDCVLWLWTTHQFLWNAKELLDKWGFEYKLTLVWNKEKMGMGVWLRCQAEFCLLGIKGKPKWNLTNERDVINEARREHSRKPDSFYQMVEKLTPIKNKIDVFGREKRDGWDIYGNEIKF